jgi:hypothetical protein
MSFRHVLQKRFTPSQLGLDGLALSAERTSNSLDIHGFGQMSIYIDFVRTAATRVDVNIDESPDFISETEQWFVPQTEAASSGTVTLSNEDYQKDVSGGSALWAIHRPINGNSARIRISSTSGGASDTVQVWVILSNQ